MPIWPYELTITTKVVDMAGIGPAPKDPSRRARGNQTERDLLKRHGVPEPTILDWESADQPELPSLQIEDDGQLIEHPWPAQTRIWWETWKASPQAEHFGITDWQFLMDTAVLHASLWRGHVSAAAELRLRVAKFGATPEDRARLRMQFADADAKDAERVDNGTSARERRVGALRPLHEDTEAA